MSNNTIIKFLKIALNFVAACFMFYFAHILFALIVEDPDCDRIFETAFYALTYTFPFALIVLTLITTINYLIQRKLEKKAVSKRYLKPTLIHLAIYFIVLIIDSISLIFICKE